MKLATRLGLVGTVDGRRDTHADSRRTQRRQIAARSTWDRLELADLDVRRRGIVVHTPTGERYRVVRGLIDAVHCPAVAYTFDGDETVFLETVP